MKTFASFTALALVISLSVGCSKHPVAPSNSKQTDLGVIEVSDGVPIQRSLGGGKVCVITPTVFTNGSVGLSIAILETNVDGTVQTLATPRVQNLAGRPMSVFVGNDAGGVGITITPKIKQ